MNTLEFAKRYIRFDRASLITGEFNIDLYPFLKAPLLANDDIETKTLIAYKSAGSMGTVFLQIIIAKHIRCDVGDGYFVAQTDDDAETWGVARGHGFILSIADIWRLRRASIQERSCFTKSLWRFRHLDFYISGPGKSSRQSKQVRLVITDESHLSDSFEDGALKEFDDRRQSAGWIGRSVHATTAADDGREVDKLFYSGQQNEYHWRCPKCHKLIWPLWRMVTKAQVCSQEFYGREIFTWDELEDEDATLDSIKATCPHCFSEFHDNVRDRASLIGDDYVAMNPNASKDINSFRWNVFAVAGLSWRTTLKKYREAVETAKLGDLSMMENFAKKQLCASWRPTMIDFGQGNGINDYKLGDKWDVQDSVLILAADYQAGKEGEGSHLWALVTQWDKLGNSRRLAYRKLSTFSKLREMQLEFGVNSSNVFVDSGYDSRTVFLQCAKWKWYATRGSDDVHILHYVKTKDGVVSFPMPYSQTERQNGNVGTKSPKRLSIELNGPLPPGWCFSRVICNPTIYGMLSALKGGLAGRYFGIASDIGKDYIEQLNSWIMFNQPNKTTNVEKPIWKKVAKDDHGWDCECLSLVGAIISGYYPVARIETLETV